MDDLNLLIMGGTRFIGPHIIREARDRGHSVTMFNRGKTNPELFPDVDRLTGDRVAGELGALEGKSWDAVIDTSAYFPHVVRHALEVLGDHIDHYLLISTISVYDGWNWDGIDEDTPRHEPLYDKDADLTGETYGPLKVACEERANEAEPGALTILRPGIVAGPGDHTDRFTYWPARAARGGQMLAPGAPSDPIQYIDVRDLAAWIVACVEDQITGTYNTVVPMGSVTMGDLIDASREAAGEDAAEPTWVDTDFLRQQDATDKCPLWAPADGETRGLHRVDTTRAIEAGMETRPVQQTATDTLDWLYEQPEERRSDLSAGLSAEREDELLSAWESHSTK
ncbi:MAG: NAD-dependent epimerase/dehydratase family protein [Myxococcota bacterium]